MRRNGRIANTITKAVAIALSFSIIFGTTLGSYADELNTINELLTEAGTDIGTATETEVDFEAIVIVDTEQVEADLAAFDVSANVVDTKSDEVIDSANVANTTSDRDVAYAAKETAENELVNAEAALEGSNASYDNAYNNFNDVSANYAEANNTYNTAVAALEDVSANTVAAEQALEAAKALIDEESIKKNKLEAMEDQYYGLMVHYFVKNGVATYDDGKLDIKESAAKMTASKQDNYAKGGDDTFFRFGRYLTKEMVEYMIISRDDVSANSEDNQFTFGVTGGTMNAPAAEAEVYTENGVEKARIGSVTETYRWTRTNKDGGRGNYVEVSYVDVNGETHIERYNYVLKTSKEDSDLTAGPIYLALIELGDNNNNTVNAVSDNNNFSNYNKLVEAVATYQVLNNYIEEYNRAAQAVSDLKARYEELSVSANASKAELETLKTALNTASEALAEAETKKAEVTAKYEEAKKAVEGIDLSRFAVVPVTVAETPAEEAPAEEPAEEPVVIILPDETPLVAVPVFAAPEGEEEDAEEVTAVVAVEEDAAPLTDGPAVTEEPEEVIAAPVVATITTDISGDNIPLAGLAFADSVKSVWWLWLLILLTAIAMYIIYKKNAKKEENK